MIHAIPYMGSKRKLAKDILNFLRNRHPEVDNLYDLFGGGGAISFNALGLFKEVHYNEIEKSMVELISEIQTNGFNPEWWQPVSREKFFENLELNTPTASVIKTCWSFGNDKRTYLYGKQIEEMKLSAHDFIVNNTDEKRLKFNQLTGLDLPLFDDNLSFYDRKIIIKRAVKGRFDLQSLERLQSFESLESLESLERLERLELSNLSYEDVEIKPNSVVYCDIPYKGTMTYKGGDGFDHEKFYKWALSQDFPIYISEYEMPKEFIEVHAFSHRSTLSATNNSNKTIEKIFWNGKGKYFKTTLF